MANIIQQNNLNKYFHS